MAKVVLVGNSSSHKTSVCYQLMGYPVQYPDYTRPPSNRDILMGRYITPTMGVEVHPYRSTNGNIYNLFDCGGKFRPVENPDRYYSQADMALIFSGGESNKTPAEWEQEIKERAPNAKIHRIEGSFEEKYAQVRRILG